MSTVRKIWENSNITNLFPVLAQSARFDEPMAEHTTFRVGGQADIFLEPENNSELVALIDWSVATGIPVSILGGGSNLLVSDRGIRGLVLSLARMVGIERIGGENPAGKRDLPADRFSAEQPDPPDSPPILVRSGAGVSMETLVEWCLREKLSGLERFAGLPGSVGGAVFMNARCYEISVSDVFFAAEVLHFWQGRCTIEKRSFRSDEWEYKKSPFQHRNGADPAVLAEDTLIVLSALFALAPGDPRIMRAEMEKRVQDRTEKGHFRYPSAGSMFRNNRMFGNPSGKIIDDAGLRGFRIGDAQVAPWHGNLVINTGHATAKDIRALVEEVRKQVYEKTGFLLESEVIFAGDW
jgi:UDP-N-acetylmuramate dehydrogenase